MSVCGTDSTMPVSVTDQDMDMDMQEGGGLIQRRQRTKHKKGKHEKNGVEHGKVF